MALKVNDTAPDFTLPSTSGTDFTLSIHQKNKPCILYFYPMDFSVHCTEQACEFKGSFDFFSNLNVDVYGISKDDIPTHERFRIAHQLPYHLLYDHKNKVAQNYDIVVPMINFTKRTTFLLDSNHKIVAVFENLFNGKKHIEEMIKNLKV